jgi:hypothetical protein
MSLLLWLGNAHTHYNRVHIIVNAFSPVIDLESIKAHHALGVATSSFRRWALFTFFFMVFDGGKPLEVDL